MLYSRVRVIVRKHSTVCQSTHTVPTFQFTDLPETTMQNTERGAAASAGILLRRIIVVSNGAVYQQYYSSHDKQ